MSERKKQIREVCSVSLLLEFVCDLSVQTLTTGLAEQVKRERVRLEIEIKQAADKAVHAVQKWYVYKLSTYT